MRYLILLIVLLVQENQSIGQSLPYYCPIYSTDYVVGNSGNVIESVNNMFIFQYTLGEVAVFTSTNQVPIISAGFNQSHDTVLVTAIDHHLIEAGNITFFPNPNSSNQLQVETTADLFLQTFALSTVDGKQIISQQFRNRESYHTVDISILSAGVYIISVVSMDQRHGYFKLMVQ